MMKRILLFLMILWGSLIVGFAQQKLDGFFRFKFGMSKETVKQGMGHRQNGTLYEEEGSVLCYIGCRFGYDDDATLFFNFTNDHLHGGSVYFSINDDLRSSVERIIESIRANYPDAIMSQEGLTETSIALWEFPNGDFIDLDILQYSSGKKALRLLYRCVSLWNIGYKQRQEDF